MPVASLLLLVALSGNPETPLADAIARTTLAEAIARELPPAPFSRLTFGTDAQPSKRDRLDVALGIVSLSASSVAMGITAACISDGSCREVNPLMAKWLGNSRTGAIVGKAVIGGLVHYVVYRFIPKGKLRTISLGVLAGVNVFDAAHDVRVMRQIEGRK